MARSYDSEPPFPRDVLPHRDPILWVDRVVSDDGTDVEAFWRPNAEHFSATSYLEEMKLVEALAQTGAYSIFRASDKPQIPLFAGIESANFGDPVTEGETVQLQVSIMDRDKRGFKGKGVAKVEDEVVCETVISGAILPERAASMYLGGKQPVISEPAVHNPNFPDPSVIFPYKVETDRWLDGVTDLSEEGANGFWLPQEAHYAGHHFGGKAVLPGIRQVGALKFLAEYHSVRAGDNVFSGIEDVSFKRPVLPGERLDLDIELDGSPNRYKGLVRVGGEVACEATLLMLFAED